MIIIAPLEQIVCGGLISQQAEWHEQANGCCMHRYHHKDRVVEALRAACLSFPSLPCPLAQRGTDRADLARETWLSSPCKGRQLHPHGCGCHLYD